MSASFESRISYNSPTSKYLVRYGDISIETIVTDKEDIARRWVQEITDNFVGNPRVVVGLDIKRRPTFLRYLSNKSATLTLCINIDTLYQ